MSLLSKMVSCGSSETGQMIEYLDGFPKQVQEILKSVTKIQRRKFKRYDLVPVPVLEAMWHLIWLPGDKVPEQGMKILDLTEYLLKGSYKNEQVRKNAKWLYETIVKEDVIGRRTFVRKEKMPVIKINFKSKPPPTPNDTKLRLKNQ